MSSMTTTERAEYVDMLKNRMSDLMTTRDRLLSVLKTETNLRAIDEWYADLLEVTDQYNKLNELQYHISKGY